MKFKIYLSLVFLFHFFIIPVAGFSDTVPVPTGKIPVSVAFSSEIPDGFFAAVANSGNNTVLVYQVCAETGIYYPLSGFLSPVGLNPQSVAFSPNVSDNFLVAVANSGDNTLSVYQLNATTNAFILVATPSTGKHPQSVAFSPLVSGQLFAAVANFGDNTVTLYRVNISSGVFKKIATRSTGRHPVSVAFSPEVSGGKLLVAVANSADDNLSVYKVNPKTGAFKRIGTPSTGKRPVSVAFSPDVLGRLFAVAANYKGDNLSVYKVNSKTSVFKLIASPSTGKNPVSVAFSSVSGNNVFFAVANEGSNSVTLYTFSLSPTVFPPKKLEGFRNDCANVLTWDAPTQGDPVSFYQIYRNNANHLKRIGVVPSDQSLRFRDRHVKFYKAYTYYVVSVNEAGNTSKPAKVVISPSAPFRK